MFSVGCKTAKVRGDWEAAGWGVGRGMGSGGTLVPERGGKVRGRMEAGGEFNRD